MSPRRAVLLVLVTELALTSSVASAQAGRAVASVGARTAAGAVGPVRSTLLSPSRGVTATWPTSNGESVRLGSRRSPVVAGALGFVVPGAGHFYAGEPRRGWTVLGVTMVGAFFALSDGMPRAASTAGSVAFVGGWGFSIVDGALAAGRWNRRH
jgi:hypothetical protein